MAKPQREMEHVRVATGPDAGYEVLVGGGIWNALPSLLAERCPAYRYAIITDDRVAELYGERLLDLLRTEGHRAERFSFPAGEAHKTRDTWASISDRMLEAGLGRDAAVIAVGGGVPGDLGGFVAATYMRGLPLVQVPTTLLAMIDSSVGGKTGVDTPAGKNLVGAFLQPRVVLADPEVLRTLPPAELRAGLAEAVKHGAIADADYLLEIECSAEQILQAEPEALTRLILRSVEIKADTVARDERESGPRKALNFGHTLGHAVEALSGFRLLHGEAVAIGTVMEAQLGEQIGVTETGTAQRLVATLAGLGLPTSVPSEFTPEQVLAATRSDKKVRSGRVEYALLKRLGAASWGHAVGDEAVLEVLGGRG